MTPSSTATIVSSSPATVPATPSVHSTMTDAAAINLVQEHIQLGNILDQAATNTRQAGASCPCLVCFRHCRGLRRHLTVKKQAAMLNVGIRANKLEALLHHGDRLAAHPHSYDQQQSHFTAKALDMAPGDSDGFLPPFTFNATTDESTKQWVARFVHWSSNASSPPPAPPAPGRRNEATFKTLNHLPIAAAAMAAATLADSAATLVATPTPSAVCVESESQTVKTARGHHHHMFARPSSPIHGRHKARANAGHHHQEDLGRKVDIAAPATPAFCGHQQPHGSDNDNGQVLLARDFLIALGLTESHASPSLGKYATYLDVPVKPTVQQPARQTRIRVTQKDAVERVCAVAANLGSALRRHFRSPQACA